MTGRHRDLATSMQMLVEDADQKGSQRLLVCILADAYLDGRLSS